MGKMVGLLFILCIDLLISNKVSALIQNEHNNNADTSGPDQYKITTIVFMASKETNSVLLAKSDAALILDKPFEFIIYSKTPLREIVCNGTKQNRNVRLFREKLHEIPDRKYFYNFTRELITTPQMQGALKCNLYYSTAGKTKFVFQNDVGYAYETGVSVSYATRRDELMSLSLSKPQQAQYGTNNEINTKQYGEITKEIPAKSSYQPSGPMYNAPYFNGHQGRQIYYYNTPKQKQTQDEVQPNANNSSISAADNIQNSTQETVYTTEKYDPEKGGSVIGSTAKTLNETKTENKEVTLSMTTLVLIIAVVIGLVGIAVGVIVGALCKMCCWKNKDQMPIVIYESRPPAEPMYEEVNKPAFIDMSSRPPYPLPPQEREENKKYIHYDTPYDHRFDRPRVLRPVGNTQQFTTSSFRKL